MGRPKGNNTSRMVRVDESLVQLIKNIQREFAGINKQPVSFTEASRALAIIYIGEPIPMQRFKNKKKEKALLLPQL